MEQVKCNEQDLELIMEQEGQTQQINFNEQGLVPAIVQDYQTKDVLMLAYMNEQSLELTKTTGYATFYSRSRKEIWKKGATSGHLQKVLFMDYDCDSDAILLQVEQTGVACHTGSWSCFSNIERKLPITDALLETILDRKENPKEGSYTSYLFDKGIDKILKKIGEETAEVIIAAKNEGTSELVYELSDLVYHSLVLMAEKGVTLEEIRTALEQRQEGKY